MLARNAFKIFPSYAKCDKICQLDILSSILTKILAFPFFGDLLFLLIFDHIIFLLIRTKGKLINLINSEASKLYFNIRKNRVSHY